MIEIVINQKEIILVRGETYLVVKLKQDQDPELIGQFLDKIIFLLLMILLQLRKKPTRSPIRQQTSTAQVEDASFKDANQAKKSRETRRVSSSARSSSKNQNSRYNVGTNKKKPRDNSSRFDD